MKRDFIQLRRAPPRLPLRPGVPENYNVAESNDTKMTASYHMKHSVHVTVAGTLLQRTNHVALVSKGGACEMQVVSKL